MRPSIDLHLVERRERRADGGASRQLGSVPARHGEQAFAHAEELPHLHATPISAASICTSIRASAGLSSKASFLRCAPGVTVPTLLIGLTGDQAAFPAVTRQMRELLGAADKTFATVRGTHFGGAIAPGEPTANVLAGAIIGPWLEERAHG